MNRYALRIWSCLLMAILLVSLAGADELPTPALEISGFSDLLFTVDDELPGGSEFAIGQAEVDVETTLDDWIDVAMAIAFDPEAGQFGLGALTMDFRLLGSDAEHRYHHESIAHAGLLAGQFDVPFGIDWRVYPSFDRQTVTAPLSSELLVAGWNDLGLAGYLETTALNAVVYVVNGSGYGGELAPSPTAGWQQALGARVGLLPWSLAEIGGSYAVFHAATDEVMSLAGLDLQLSWRAMNLKGEYVSLRVGETSNEATIEDSYYVQGMYRFSSHFAVARYGIFTSSQPGDDPAERLNVCGGWIIGSGCELRGEYQVGLSGVDNLFIAQLAVAF